MLVFPGFLSSLSVLPTLEESSSTSTLSTSILAPMQEAQKEGRKSKQKLLSWKFLGISKLEGVGE
jgi:hypothetical protein